MNDLSVGSGVEVRSADNPEYAGIDSLTATILRITDGFSSDLRLFYSDCNGDDSLIRALGDFIDVLEKIYVHMQGFERR